jgi:acyl-CoA synthetase (NDP forming)
VADDVEEQGRAISAAAQGARKPVAAVFMSLDSPPLALAGSAVPTYVFPESAAEAMAHAARYAVWRERDLGQVVTFDDVDVPGARAVVEAALAGKASGQTMALPPPQTGELLTAFGISTALSGLVHDSEHAGRVAGELGGALVVKSAAPIQKADRGLVRLGLDGPDAVAQAVEQMTQTMVDAGDSFLLPHGWLVQRMVPDGVEVVVEVRSDPTFGPVLVVGLGGAMAELLGDVSMRIHPLTDVDVDDMLLQLKGYPMLTGYRGRPPVDVTALKFLLLRIAELVESVPEIVSVDLNPVFVRRRGISVVDSTIRLGRGRRSRDPLQE